MIDAAAALMAAAQRMQRDVGKRPPDLMQPALLQPQFEAAEADAGLFIARVLRRFVADP
jgi:hypothetical protein